jgi:ribonuclease P protein component
VVLPKQEKLKNRNAFRKTFNLKLITKNKYFKLLGKLSFEKEKTSFPKVGLVLSRKKVKLASKRNLVKRRLEEAYRTNRHLLLSELRSYDYLIFFIEGEIVKASFNELENILLAIKTKSLK